jgi:hypothetical protein
MDTNSGWERPRPADGTVLRRQLPHRVGPQSNLGVDMIPGQAADAKASAPQLARSTAYELGDKLNAPT